MRKFSVLVLLFITLGVAGFSQLLNSSTGSTAFKETVEPVIPLKVDLFDLADVQLREGPFMKAMEANVGYMLYLEPDRFLSWYRKEAGLEPKGEVYGGWESDGYILTGHTLGHYISALAKQYRATGDERFKERLDYIVDEFELIQQAHGDGYIMGIPDGRAMWDEIAAGNIRPRGFSLNGANVPWYNLDKTIYGLTDAYLLAHNAKALDVVNKFVDYLWEKTGHLTDEQWQRMISVEYGGMIHSFADLYAITGNSMHLEFAEKFYHNSVLDPLAERQDILNGLHSNTQIPKVRGVARIHELTFNKSYETIADFFWHQVVNAHSYVNGGHSHREYFGLPHQLNDRMVQTSETCNTSNMLWLTRMLFTWEPDGYLMDFYERALFNHILASQNPENGMVKYKGYVDMPARKGFSHPTNSFWCCVGSGLENHTIYGKDIYYHRGDSLYVNLFMASDLSWEEKGVKVTQETIFPAEEGSKLVFNTAQPVEMSLLVREPGWWGTDFQIFVNGERQRLINPLNGYHEIRRTFSNGDVVEVYMPMEFRIETMPDNRDRIAFFYGPVLLNAIVENREIVPELKGSWKELIESLVPVPGEPLHYKAMGVGRLLNEETGEYEVADIYLKPQYQTVTERYTIYMDVQ